MGGSVRGNAVLGGLIGAVAALSVADVVHAQVVDRVEIVGVSRVDEATVRLQVGTKPAKPLDSAQVDNDIKNIYRLGNFERVEAQVQESGGKVTVRYVVKEKPAIRSVSLKGNDDISEDTIKSKIDLGGRRFLDRKKLNAAVSEIEKLYADKGYFGTKVEVTEKRAANNQVDIILNVTEGKKKVIREIAFEGNHAVDSSDLKDVISTSTRGWFSWLTGSGVVKKDQLANDVRELTHLYLNRGYLEAKVSEPIIEELEDGLKIVFRVSEGDQYSVGRIAASGDLVNRSQEETLKGIELKSEETFAVDKLRKDTFTVSDKFTDVGYAFANVEPQTDLNREKKTVDVTFKVDKGKKVKIDQINITGNSKTEDHVVRRSLKVSEQETYSSSKIRRSQELLKRLGYFDEVSITPETSQQQDQVNLNVAVKEANTGSFTLGAGLSSGEGFIVSGKIAERNLFGTGNSVSLDVNTGNINRNYILSFENPRINDSYVSGGVSLLSVERHLDDFTRNQTGGSVNLGYPLLFLGEDVAEDYKAGLTYELVNVDISDVEADAAQLVKDSEGSSVSSSIMPKLVRNTINNPLRPTEGSRELVSFEYGGLGGDEEFWVAEAATTLYYPLWESPLGLFVFSQRNRLGYGESMNDDPFPLFKRYFPGGINSVRGYDSRELGPKDLNGKFYGGSKQYVGNFDLIVPIIDAIGLNGVVFYDLGNAFDDDQSMDVGDLRQAYGFGFRWNTPIAPLRVEFGFPIGREDGESAMVTHFSFGSPL